jgi:hypothetical protein
MENPKMTTSIHMATNRPKFAKVLIFNKFRLTFKAATLAAPIPRNQAKPTACRLHFGLNDKNNPKSPLYL